jgi:protein-tyrosine-phosphatase
MLNKMEVIVKENYILFVCTGNTCRSPMAESFFNQLATKLDLRAMSCGLSVKYPEPASSGARKAAAKYGADLSGHQSQPVSESLISNAAGVYCMTAGHAEKLKYRYQDHAGLIQTLGKIDITDPYGSSDLDYERTALQIRCCVSDLIEQLKKLC